MGGCKQMIIQAWAIKSYMKDYEEKGEVIVNGYAKNNYIKLTKEQYQLEILEMIGCKVIDIIIVVSERNEDKRAMLIVTENAVYHFEHDQQCCEYVYLEEIIGDINDLIGQTLTMAEVVFEWVKSNDNHDDDEVKAWTFYKFATVKGYVTMRWVGESNGYYSVDVDVIKHKKKEENKWE